MKFTLKLMTFFLAFTLLSCGGAEEKKTNKPTYGKKKITTKVEKKENKATSTPASQTINLTDKGVGPIKSVKLGDTVDEKMAAHGAEVFKKMCTACHRPDKKFIGPAPKNILARRSPEWVMNMILNPEGMVKNDALAKKLLIEFNGSPMANQNLSKEDARAVLEYFRTLK